MKRSLIRTALLLLILACAVTGASADAELSGWQKKGGYQYVSLGQYPYEEDGTPRPVLWDVLSVSDGKALLLTDLVIDAHQVVECHDADAIEKKEFRHITDYADADLIAYMNGPMLKTMFADEPMVNALVEEEYGRLYMLTSPQYRIAEYGFTTGYTQKSATRVVEGTPYLFTVQQFDGANRVQHQAGLKGVTYWAIAIKPERDWMQIVGGDGHMSWAGYCRTNVGIRAALTLDLSQCEIKGGSGTKDSPYTLTYTGSGAAGASAFAAPAASPAVEAEASEETEETAEIEYADAPEAEDGGLLAEEGETLLPEEGASLLPEEGENAAEEDTIFAPVTAATIAPLLQTIAPISQTPAPASGAAAAAATAAPAVTAQADAGGFPNLLVDMFSVTVAPAAAVPAATPAPVSQPAETAAPAAAAPAPAATAALQTIAPIAAAADSAETADAASTESDPFDGVTVEETSERPWGTGLFSFIGDCSIGDATQSRSRKTSLTNVIADNGMDYPFSTGAEYFLADDGTFANLEVCFTTQAKLRSTRVFNLLAPPEYAQCLNEGGIDVVNTVNNHALDFKNAGYTDTMNSLDAANVNHFGTLRPDKEGFDHITTHEANGIKIGFVGFSYPQNSDIKRIQERVTKLRKEEGCNFVVVSLHWGRETHLTPNAGQFPYAKQVIDAGADMVWGHHPHVLQPIYFYKGKPILFSTGNYIFGTMGNADRSSGIFQLTVSLNGDGEGHVDSIHVVPLRTNSSPTYVPDVLTETEDMQACWRKLIGKKEMSGCVPVPAAFETSGTVYIDAQGNLSCP